MFGYFLATRPMTLGVRGVAFDADDRVLLVKHGYLPGWHFPGGGVEVGETCERSLVREMEEEARVARVVSSPSRGRWRCMGCSTTSINRRATMSRSM
jgi:ADP-ribose pyrophosphatase YjhB (NUDIX family)